jgi:hypothetical protein
MKKTQQRPARELKEAGSSASDLKEAGYLASDLKEAGVSLIELKEARYSASDLKEAGYLASDLKEAGVSLIELKEARYSASDLKKARYSARELYTAGCSLDELKETGYSSGKLVEACLSPEELAERVLSRTVSSAKPPPPTKRSFSVEAGGVLSTAFGVELLVEAGTKINGAISVSLVAAAQVASMAPPPSGFMTVGPLIEVRPHSGHGSGFFEQPVTMRLPHSSLSWHSCRVLHCENIGDPWSEIHVCKGFDRYVEVAVHHFSFFTVIQAESLRERVCSRAYRRAELDALFQEIKLQVWVVPDSDDQLHALRLERAECGFKECGVAEGFFDTVNGTIFKVNFDGHNRERRWKSQEAQLLFDIPVRFTPEDAGQTIEREVTIENSLATAVHNYKADQISQLIAGLADTPAFRCYAEAFEEGAIDGSFLLEEIDDETLKEDLDVQNKLHRKRMLGLIGELKKTRLQKLHFTIPVPARRMAVSHSIADTRRLSMGDIADAARQQAIARATATARSKPLTEGGATGVHTAIQEIAAVVAQARKEANEARSLPLDCACLGNRLLALSGSLKDCIKGDEPEMATLLSHAQLARNLIRLHSSEGWLLRLIALDEHSYSYSWLSFAAVDDKLLVSVASVDNWDGARMAMQATQARCYGSYQSLRSDLKRRKLLELLQKAYMAAQDRARIVLPKEAEQEICDQFGIEVSELTTEVDLVSANGGIKLLRRALFWMETAESSGSDGGGDDDCENDERPIESRYGAEPKECVAMVGFNQRSAGDDAVSLARFLHYQCGVPTFCTGLWCLAHPGQNWRNPTADGAMTCKFFVVLITGDTAEKGRCWQRSENTISEFKNLVLGRWEREECKVVPVFYPQGHRFATEYPDPSKQLRWIESVQRVDRGAADWQQQVSSACGVACRKKENEVTVEEEEAQEQPVLKEAGEQIANGAGEHACRSIGDEVSAREMATSTSNLQGIMQSEVVIVHRSDGCWTYAKLTKIVADGMTLLLGGGAMKVVLPDCYSEIKRLQPPPVSSANPQTKVPWLLCFSLFDNHQLAHCC